MASLQLVVNRDAPPFKWIQLKDVWLFDSGIQLVVMLVQHRPSGLIECHYNGRVTEYFGSLDDVKAMVEHWWQNPRRSVVY
jgi:hypothetical protein